MLRTKPRLTPLTWPVLAYFCAILIGTALLLLPPCIQDGRQISFIDALFTATSAVCVTGLSSVDIGTTFSRLGQSVILLLVQLGGLGIAIYTSLLALMWSKKIPFSNRLAVVQALQDTEILPLRRLVVRIMLLTLSIECVTAVLLYCCAPLYFDAFTSVFHAVSAFCNAGFSTFSNNLMPLYNAPLPAMIIAGSIICGGLGFIVLQDILECVLARLRGLYTTIFCNNRYAGTTYYARTLPQPPLQRGLSGYSRLVLTITGILIVVGGCSFFLTEALSVHSSSRSIDSLTLGCIAFFQTISARTAGFNTVSMLQLTDTSLMLLMALMFIGGSPGSCAGGIKTTTFATLCGYFWSQLRGEQQIVFGRRAVSHDSVNSALLLFFFTCFAISISVFLLSICENGFTSVGHKDDIPLIKLLFEVISAIATVGLSMDVTPTLSAPGKLVLIANMFIGRVGLITVLTALQSLRTVKPFSYPQTDIPIG